VLLAVGHLHPCRRVPDDLHLFGHAVFMFAASILPSVCLFMLLIVTSMLVPCGRNSVALPV
jgi:hypothetical protein